MYKLTLRLFQLTSNFSREYKFTLGQDMKRDAILLVRSIYRANRVREKVPYLEQFMDNFEVLKLEIRLCTDLHLVTVKQQADMALAMDSIGKQITGWRMCRKQCCKKLAVTCMKCAAFHNVKRLKKR